MRGQQGKSRKTREVNPKVSSCWMLSEQDIDTDSVQNAKMKARHRNHRARIQKYLWVAGTVGAAATAMGENVSYNFTSQSDSSLSSFSSVTVAPPGANSILNEAVLDAGFSAMWSSLTLRPYFPMFRPLLDAGIESQLQSDDATWNGADHGGAVWKLSKNQSFSVAYSSPFETDFRSEIAGDNFDPALAVPSIFGVGYGLKLTDALSLETDFAWMQFARFYSQGFGAADGHGFFSGNPTSVLGNWHNALVSSLNADWKFAEHWILRAGYQFFENPVHNSGFSPSIPDVNQHVLSLGVGWKGKRSSVEVAYALDFYYDRHIANDAQPGFDGAYGFNGHLLSLAYKFSF